MTLIDTLALAGAFIIVLAMAVGIYELITDEDEDYEHISSRTSRK